MKTYSNKSLLTAALAMLLNLSFQLPTTFGQNVRTVSLSTQTAPGVGNNVEFTTFFQTPVLNQNSETAFAAFYVGPGVGNGNDHAIFRETAGVGLGILARAGEPATGAGPGANFEFFDSPILNSNGDSAFHANLIGGGVTAISDTGIFREGIAGGVNMVARKGNTAPTAAINVDYAGFSQLMFSATGQTAFVADLAGPGVNDMNDTGIFRELMGPGVANIARAGDAAPGTGAGVFYSEFSKLLLNKMGKIAYLADLDGPSVNSTNDQGIFSEGPGGMIALIARAGDPAPIGNGVLYQTLLEPAFNDGGRIAFAASLTGTGVNENNDQALFREDATNGVELAYRTGNPTPGTANGVQFSFFGIPLLNQSGQLAFVAGLTGMDVVEESNDLAIFREPATGPLELVARTGDAAPGTDATFRTFSKPSFNDEGQVAFIGVLNGSNVTSSNDIGIFAQDLAGQLKLIAREGDELDVSDDPTTPDFRVISDGSFGSLEDRNLKVNGFNNLGRLVFFAEFEDSSEGIFIANTTVLLGDLNGDGLVNLLDVSPFVDALSNGVFVEAGDINQDGILNLLDVSPFIDILAG